MALFRYGNIIRNRREDLGLTQEDLADGICSVPTLSRIENGERMPTKNHFEMLMQRIGYSGTNLDCYVSENDFIIHELQFQVRQAYIDGNLERAKELLDRYEQLNTDLTQISKQFLLLYRTLLHQKEYSVEEQKIHYENALSLTCPKFASSSHKKIPHVLSYEEIILIHNISNCNFILGDQHNAIEVMFQLKAYHQNHIVNPEESLRTQPLILYNLSKMLGMVGRYDECIAVCNDAIRLAKSTGRCSFLAKILYNKAWALLRRGEIGDSLAAQHTAKMAYNMAAIMGKMKSAEHYRHFIEENFGENGLL